MIESNLIQRGFGELKPSEQAKILSLRYESIFSQGKRTDIINELMALEGKLPEKKHDSREKVGEEYGLSRNTVARLLRINKLNDGIKSWVDSGNLSVRAAVELSYMSEDRQQELYKTNTDFDTGVILKKISEKTAKELRKQSPEKTVKEILSNKKSATKSIKINSEVYDRYFGGMDSKEITAVVEQALKMYFS